MAVCCIPMLPEKSMSYAPPWFCAHNAAATRTFHADVCTGQRNAGARSLGWEPSEMRGGQRQRKKMATPPAASERRACLDVYCVRTGSANSTSYVPAAAVDCGGGWVAAVSMFSAKSLSYAPACTHGAPATRTFHVGVCNGQHNAGDVTSAGARGLRWESSERCGGQRRQRKMATPPAASERRACLDVYCVRTGSAKSLS